MPEKRLYVSELGRVGRWVDKDLVAYVDRKRDRFLIFQSDDEDQWNNNPKRAFRTLKDLVEFVEYPSSMDILDIGAFMTRTINEVARASEDIYLVCLDRGYQVDLKKLTSGESAAYCISYRIPGKEAPGEDPPPGKKGAEDGNTPEAPGKAGGKAPGSRNHDPDEMGDFLQFFREPPEEAISPRETGSGKRETPPETLDPFQSAMEIGERISREREEPEERTEKRELKKPVPVKPKRKAKETSGGPDSGKPPMHWEPVRTEREKKEDGAATEEKDRESPEEAAGKDPGKKPEEKPGREAENQPGEGREAPEAEEEAEDGKPEEEDLPRRPPRRRRPPQEEAEETPSHQKTEEELLAEKNSLMLRMMETSILGRERQYGEIEQVYTELDDAKAVVVDSFRTRLCGHIRRWIPAMKGYDVSEEGYDHFLELVARASDAKDFENSWQAYAPNWKVTFEGNAFKMVKSEAAYYFKVSALLYDGDFWDYQA